MSMMRRGPLDRYSAEWVLRQASALQISGSIELHTDRPATFFLDEGRVYAAVTGTGTDAAMIAAAIDHLPAEGEARAEALRLLAPALATDQGWYYHDPLGHHPARGSWQWEPATLLLEARTQAHEQTALVNWSDRRVRLHDIGGAAITLDADAWSVVVALAEAAGAGELRARLGWSPTRLAAALNQIDQRGALDPDLPTTVSAGDLQMPAARPLDAAVPPPPARRRAAPLPPPPEALPQAVGAPLEAVPGRHVGPLPPPPTWSPDGGSGASKGRRRSLRPSRRD